MTDVPPTGQDRAPAQDNPDLDAEELEKGREARKAGANQDPLATNNPAEKSTTPSTGGDGAAGAGGPKGFGTGT